MLIKIIKVIKINYKIILLFLLLFIGFFFIKKEIVVVGEVMGTNYSVRLVSNFFDSKSKLNFFIKSLLYEIEKNFSIYNNNSEISKFNFLENLDDKIYPSDNFLNLLLISKKIYEITGGIWDPTIGSIVNIWGFGRDRFEYNDISGEKIQSLLNDVGFNKAIIFCGDNSLKKGFKSVKIDFASIAKGFAVDQLAFFLCSKGYKNFLIELGGEIYSKGYNKNNNYWRVGINYPNEILNLSKIYKILLLSDKAVATSGNYRNFRFINGKKYSHIINPRTGYPISNNIVSVTVIAENCTIADALATTFMLIKPENSLIFVNNLPSVECIIVVKTDNKLKYFNSCGIHTLNY